MAGRPMVRTEITCLTGGPAGLDLGVQDKAPNAFFFFFFFLSG